METLVKKSIKELLHLINLENTLSVSLTMKQRVGFQKLDSINSSQNIRHFMNILNSSLYGNAFKRHKRCLGVVPVLENSLSNRLHYHLILECPKVIPEDDFKKLIDSCWKKTKFGYGEIDIQNIYSDGWIDYITKFKSSEDQVDWVNFHWNY